MAIHLDQSQGFLIGQRFAYWSRLSLLFISTPYQHGLLPAWTFVADKRVTQAFVHRPIPQAVKLLLVICG
jgi:hypothetical protein